MAHHRSLPARPHQEQVGALFAIRRNPEGCIRPAVLPGLPFIGVPDFEDDEQESCAVGEEAWKKCEKVNAELFSAVYRAFIVQLILDIQDPERVNAALFDLYISQLNLSHGTGCWYAHH